jgi:hypothetical protein
MVKSIEQIKKELNENILRDTGKPFVPISDELAKTTKINILKMKLADVNFMDDSPLKTKRLKTINNKLKKLGGL